MDSKINKNLAIPLQSIEGGQLYYEFKVFFGELARKTDKKFPNEIFVKAHIEKADKDYLIRINIYTTARLICDRCAEEFSKNIAEEITVLSSFKKDQVNLDMSNEIKLLSAQSGSINITQEVLDQLILSIPQKVLCKKDCKGLCSKCGANLNRTSCKCKKNYIDPLWKKLQDIDFND
ncbi:MAG: DUF177 domain-containing protein [bacterium]